MIVIRIMYYWKIEWK